MLLCRYSDGASGNALLTDLLRIYAEDMEREDVTALLHFESVEEANLDLATSTELHSPPEHLAAGLHFTARGRRAKFPLR